MTKRTTAIEAIKPNAARATPSTQKRKQIMITFLYCLFWIIIKSIVPHKDGLTRIITWIIGLTIGGTLYSSPPALPTPNKKPSNIWSMNITITIGSNISILKETYFLYLIFAKYLYRSYKIILGIMHIIRATRRPIQFRFTSQSRKSPL